MKQHKPYIKMFNQVSKLFRNFINNPSEHEGKKQINFGESYLPKRSPEDGEINCLCQQKQ